jgi:hypothetical protein
LSCEEPFPVYQEPQNVLKTELTLTAKDTISCSFDSVGNAYFFNDQLTFNTTITNIHDDLLQGDARINGFIRVQSFGAVSRTVLVTLTPAELRFPPLFQGRLALAPGKSAQFVSIWVPIATDKKAVFVGFPYNVVNGKRLYGPVDFLAATTVQIYDRVQHIQSENLKFKLYFRID